MTTVLLVISSLGLAVATLIIVRAIRQQQEEQARLVALLRDVAAAIRDLKPLR